MLATVSRSRVSLLVLYGGEAPLSSEEVADISSGGPGQEGTEHPLTHLERRLGELENRGIGEWLNEGMVE